MSEHDDLRVRLARQDPAPALDPVESPRAPELLERIMSTPVLDQPTSSRRRWVPVAAAAVAAAAVAVAVVSLGGSSSTPKKAPTTLALKLPGGSGPTMGSCIRFDPAILKDMSPAFGGTVTSVSDGKVVLDVDHWYAGGTADQVSLATAQPGTTAELDGVTFEPGKRYLVTAAQGNVNGCGYSGLATPELQKAFTEAFGG